MIKDPDAYYEWDRSASWKKMKPKNSYEGTIIEICYGNNRLSNTMGHVIIEGHDESGNYFKTKVGSGFDDVTREFIMRNRDDVIGKTIEVEAFEITEDNALRFPIFKCFRYDK